MLLAQVASSAAGWYLHAANQVVERKDSAALQSTCDAAGQYREALETSGTVPIRQAALSQAGDSYR